MRERDYREGMLASTAASATSNGDRAPGLVTEAAELTSEGEIEDVNEGSKLGEESATSSGTAPIEELEREQDGGATVVDASPSQSSAVPSQVSEPVVEPSDEVLDAGGRVNQSHSEAGGGVGPSVTSTSSEVESKEGTGPNDGTANIMDKDDASPRVGSPEVEGKMTSGSAEEPAVSGVPGSSGSITGSPEGSPVSGDAAPPAVSEEDERRAQSKVKLGLARLQKGQYNIAASIFDKAASLHPSWWAGYYYGAEGELHAALPCSRWRDGWLGAFLRNVDRG